MIKNIGILTSGGDSPGMNVVIRSVVKCSILNNINIFGIKDGFFGLFNNNFIKLDNNKINNILNDGGTILKSSRFEEFKNFNVRLKSAENLKKNKINTLIIIGGNGSYLGASELLKIGINCICIPGTIDNDILGTDYSIGFYSAVETITNLINNLKYTAFSHRRILIVEVMGRKCGNLAIFSSISSECNFVIIPEINFSKEELIKKIINNNNKYFIIIITENTYDLKLLSKFIEKKTNRITKVVILGYLQRGGNPSVFDKILASKMGCYSISLIKKNIKNICIGIKNDNLVFYKIEEFINMKGNNFNTNIYKIKDLLF